jgi:DNA-binding beta-propeller fold protein YncE
LVRTVALPGGLQPYGETLSPDGRHLLAAAGTGAVVIDTATAERGKFPPVLGVLSSMHGAQQAGAVEVAVSPDGAYAFVSLEYRDAIAVFDLRAAAASHYRRSGFVGLVPLGQGVVGTAVSPDGRWLYATSEFAVGQNPQASQTHGTLSVIDARRAESEPARAVLASVAAGCQPVRVATAGGANVWVTARGSNALLAFSAADLHDASAQHALRANVHVGEEPVGLALVDNGRRIVVADSDRFQAPGAQPTLSVVDPNAALVGRPALLGSIGTGAFPREMALAPGRGILEVSDYGSNQLQTIDLMTLP